MSALAMEKHGTLRHLTMISLDQLSIVEIADVLNQGYQGYAVPIPFTTEGLARRILADHVDLTRSLAFLDASGQLLGCIMMARRGRRSRIAALGVALDARGTGVGRRAIESVIARARQDRDDGIILEVLPDNLPARRLYESVGFVQRRGLVGYERTVAGDEASAEAIEEYDIEAVLADLFAAYPRDVTWQVSPLSFAAATNPMRAFRSSSGAVCLVEPGPAGMRLAAIAVPRERRGRGHGRDLLASAVARFPGQRWHVPAFVPEMLANRFFVASGWNRTPLTQIEMELVL